MVPIRIKNRGYEFIRAIALNYWTVLQIGILKAVLT